MRKAVSDYLMKELRINGEVKLHGFGNFVLRYAWTFFGLEIDSVPLILVAISLRCSHLVHSQNDNDAIRRRA
jgi:hypothetical protein